MPSVAAQTIMSTEPFLAIKPHLLKATHGSGACSISENIAAAIEFRALLKKVNNETDVLFIDQDNFKVCPESELDDDDKLDASTTTILFANRFDPTLIEMRGKMREKITVKDALESVDRYLTAVTPRQNVLDRERRIETSLGRTPVLYDRPLKPRPPPKVQTASLQAQHPPSPMGLTAHRPHANFFKRFIPSEKLATLSSETNMKEFLQQGEALGYNRKNVLEPLMKNENGLKSKFPGWQITTSLAELNHIQRNTVNVCIANSVIGICWSYGQEQFRHTLLSKDTLSGILTTVEHERFFQETDQLGYKSLPSIIHELGKAFPGYPIEISRTHDGLSRKPGQIHIYITGDPGDEKIKITFSKPLSPERVTLTLLKDHTADYVLQAASKHLKAEAALMRPIDSAANPGLIDLPPKKMSNQSAPEPFKETPA